MPFDTLVVQAIACEVRERAGGARVARVFQPERLALLLWLRTGSDEIGLAIHASPSHPRVHLTGARAKAPASTPPFCQLARRRLEGARLEEVVAPLGERVLEFVFVGRDDLGDPTPYRLVAEVMGKRSNAILVGPDGRIVDALRRASREVNPVREVLPGQPYLPPPARPVPNAFAAAAPAREEALRRAAGQPGSEALTRSLGGLGPFLAREVLLQAGLDPDGPLPADPTPVLAALAQLAEEVASGRFSPTLLVDAVGQPLDVWAFPPLQWRGRTTQPGRGMSELVERCFGHLAQMEALSSERGNLLRAVDQAGERLRRKLAAQEVELLEAEDAEQLRREGEVLLANLWRLAPGMSRAELEDFSGQPIAIELDPKLTPVQNAEERFRRYRKAQRRRVALAGEMERARLELAYLEGVRLAVEQAPTAEELAAIRAELRGRGYLGAAPPSPTAPPLPRTRPLVYRTRDGHEILVGRTMAENEHLTLRVARPDDIFLHVKDLPGSHCILRLRPGEEPDAQTLLEAARVAAYHSRGRRGSNVAVDFTRRRHVRKAPGSPPGHVLYDHHRTLFVTPDPEALPERVSPPEPRDA